MSTNQKSFKQMTKTVQHFIGRKNGFALSNGYKFASKDRQVLIDAYTLKSVILFDFLGPTKWFSSYPALARAWLDMPVDTALEFWDEFDRLLFRQKSDEELFGSLVSYDGLKRHLIGVYPGSLPIVAAFKGDIEKVFSSDFSRSQELRSVFLLESRVTLTECEEFLNECLEKNNTNELLNATTKLPDVSEMRSYITEWMTYVNPWDDFRPYFGPGATAESITEERSYFKSFYRSKLGKYIDSNTDVVNEFLVNIPFCRDYGHSLKEIMACDGIPVHEQSYCSAAVAVPKGLTSKRLIAACPAGLGFLQKGFTRSLDFANIPFLSKRVDLVHGDEVNKNMALSGSKYPSEFCTIDMSSASDLVSWRLVRELFRDTKWISVMEATRSTHTLLPNGVISENELAFRAGEPFCFPIECLVFSSAIATCVAQVAKETGIIYGLWAVYGDDMVVHQAVVEKLLALLVSLGMKPNPKKSFYGGEFFRESCGGEFYKGVDITPLRISRKFSGLKTSESKKTIQPDGSEKETVIYLASRIASNIDLMNRAHIVYPSLRKFIWQESILPLPGWKQPGFTSYMYDTSKIISEYATNYLATAESKRKRSFSPDKRLPMIKHGCKPREPWNDYQCDYIRVGQLDARSESEVSLLSEYLQYFDRMCNALDKMSADESRWRELVTLPEKLHPGDKPRGSAAFAIGLLGAFQDEWDSPPLPLSASKPEVFWVSTWIPQVRYEIVDVTDLETLDSHWAT